MEGEGQWGRGRQAPLPLRSHPHSNADQNNGPSSPFHLWWSPLGGETVAYTREVMTFQSDAVIGSPEEPAVINFSDSQTYEEGKWYTLDGLQLQQKPTQKGVYIFNGEKVVIK